MQSIPDWLKESNKYTERFEKLREKCTEKHNEKRLVGKTLIELNGNTELLSMEDLAKIFGCGTGTALEFINFLDTNKLIEKKVLGSGRVKRTQITIL